MYLSVLFLNTFTLVASFYNPQCVCLYVCYVATPRRFATRASDFQGSIYEPTVGSAHFYILKFTLSMRTIVDNAMRVFFDCPKLFNGKANGKCTKSSYPFNILKTSV